MPDSDIYLPVNHETTASWQTSCALLQCHTCAILNANAQVNLLVQDERQHPAAGGRQKCYPPWWLRTLKCSVCYETWSICIECANVRKTFTTPQQVRRHNTRKHFLISDAGQEDQSGNSNKRQRVVEDITFLTPNIPHVNAFGEPENP
jgi:hypothetical protein